jgi:nitronate monooxygenase
MAISTPLTRALGLDFPIVLAPMGSVAGGRLAAAVSNAGGLGLVGGGYGNLESLETELGLVRELTRRPWGVGLIAWHASPAAVDLCLSYQPPVFFLSFGDPRPFVPAIKGTGCRLICQVQSVEEARLPLAAGDFDTAMVWAGEAADLITGVEPAADLVRRIGGEAEACLRQGIALLK